jgi:hypothetical protein
MTGTGNAACRPVNPDSEMGDETQRSGCDPYFFSQTRADRVFYHSPANRHSADLEAADDLGNHGAGSLSSHPHWRVLRQQLHPVPSRYDTHRPRKVRPRNVEGIPPPYEATITFQRLKIRKLEQEIKELKAFLCKGDSQFDGLVQGITEMSLHSPSNP